MELGRFIMGDSGSNLSQLENTLWHVRYTILLQLRHYRERLWNVWTVELPEPVETQVERQLARLTAPHGSVRFQT